MFGHTIATDGRLRKTFNVVFGTTDFYRKNRQCRLPNGIERLRESQLISIPEFHARLGRAGGLARARTAWRYFDGTFMSQSVKLETRVAEYERSVVGGRARAAKALRAPDGTFLSTA